MHKFLPAACLLLVFAGCRDADIEEMVTDEYTFAFDEEVAADAEGVTAADSSVDVSGASPRTASTTSGNQDSPMHAPGQRNASTAWLFHQPWAARVFWKKMLRDSAILLLLSGIVLFVSRERQE